MSMNDCGSTMLVQPAGMGNSGGFGFGGDDGWLAILFLFGLMGGGFGGFGGMGGGIWPLLLMMNGGFGGWGGGQNGGVGSEVQRGFDHSSVVTKLDGITQGICDSTYALNNAITNGFHGVDTAICNVGYQTQAGFNALGAQLAQCCCDTREAISGVRYDMATQACDTRNTIQNSTRDILENANANSRAILDALNQNYIRSLESENQGLKLAASQANQNAYLTATIDAAQANLIRRLGADCPQPAYVVQPPTPVSFNGCGTGFSGYGGCGCGGG